MSFFTGFSLFNKGRNGADDERIHTAWSVLQRMSAKLVRVQKAHAPLVEKQRLSVEKLL